MTPARLAAEIRSAEDRLDLIAQLDDYLAEARRICRPPISISATITEIVKLFGHYPMTGRSKAVDQQVYLDWADDLADVPLDLVVMACRQWRRDGNEFRPSPGLLLAFIKPALKMRELLLDRAARTAAELKA